MFYLTSRSLAVFVALAVAALIAGLSAVAGEQTTAPDNQAAQPFPIVRRANSRTPVDTSTIRGANYCYAEFGNHRGMWANYSPSVTERDLGYAPKVSVDEGLKRLGERLRAG